LKAADNEFFIIVFMILLLSYVVFTCGY